MSRMIFDSNLVFIQCLSLVANKWPQRAAVEVDGEVKLTYAKLWHDAERIATALYEKGCTNESVVAIALPKSAAAITAVVGVWRSGAAWIPIPPELPAEQRQYMLRDSGAKYVISDRYLLADAEFERDAELEIIEVEGAVLRQGPPALDVHYSVDDLAYIIYTSGTTGKPRGVAVTHRGLVSMLQQQIKATGMHDQSRSLFLLSMTFDAAISDIGTALLSGATLCIETSVSQSGRLGVTAAELTEIIKKRGITYIDIPPSLLARMSSDKCPTSLECVLVGGEVCPVKTVRSWAASTRVVNVYGPTEATVCSSLSVCSTKWDHPLIGQPLQGVEYQIDGDDSEGELLISGSFLARNYVGLPELTQSRFPIIEGVRCYRTGDFVRRTEDGEYLFLGRIDRQVKIRGHRIEPEQIEVALQGHSGVRRAAVIQRNYNAGTASLIAFVTLEPEYHWRDAPDVILRGLITRTLPYWMMPDGFEILRSLPVTSTGKVDYRQLSERISEQFGVDSGEIPTDLSGVQCVLLELYRTLLSNSRIGLDDDFLLVGGDSLQVMELILVARSRGIPLTASDVVQWRTVRAIGTYLEQKTKQCPDDTSVSIEKHSASIQTSVLRADLESLPSVEIVGTTEMKPELPYLQPHVFLTGATGFLGGHVLQQLIQRTSFQISCLVRSPDRDCAHKRLRDCLQSLGIVLNEREWSRIKLVAGDVSLCQFGLSQPDYEEVSKQISHILHCAADINALADYESLRSANVIGTAEVARFAANHRPKNLMAVSTLSVFVNSDRFEGTFLESDDLSGTRSMFGGYAQSKWVAECYLRAQHGLLPFLQIVRPGLLVPDDTSLAVPKDDLLTMTVRGLVKLGCVPKCEPNVRLDTTPITFAAKAMAYLLEHGSYSASTYHLAHPSGITANELFAAIRKLRPHIRLLSPSDFENAMKERIRVDGWLDPTEAMACQAVSRRITPYGELAYPDSLDLFLATNCCFDYSETKSQLCKSDIKLPTVDEDSAVSIVEKILS